MFLEVIILGPVWGSFDYLPPDPLPQHPLRIGARVLVPFGKKSTPTTGILTRINPSSDCPTDKLKRAIDILDPEPLLPPSLLRLGEWLHQYYHCPPGEAWSLLFPKRLRAGGSNDWPKRAGKKKNQKTVSIADTHATDCILNTNQSAAIDAIVQALGQFQAFLLEGVTGSGKTEVYLQIIESVIQRGQQTLILVPEIALTPQTLRRFEARFNCPLAILHSGMTDALRFYHWKMASEGLAPIVIGTRSAAFVPLKNPGLFVVDEEHDLSFKQQTGVRYAARDVLMMRAYLEKCPIVLGSATPSLESLYNVQQQKYTGLALPHRAGGAAAPALHLINPRNEKTISGISGTLKRKIQEHLAQHRQVLLFLNRRGYATVLFCQSCGWKAQCKRCDAHLVYHHKKNCLKCHHCLSTTALPTQCPNCQATPLKPVGVGTEKVESILAEWFPEYPIIRIDRDVIQHPEALQDALAHIHTNAPLIILGTQMISKGHHFKNVTLVGIVDIDGAFFSADFRSQERLGQLIIQVGGRAGREQYAGEVLLQTHFPTHPLLSTLLKSGYPAFAKALLAEREAMELPPFSHQILWQAESKHPKRASDFLNWIKEKSQALPANNALQILGPVPALMEKKMGHYRAQLIIQTQNRKQLHHWAKQLLTQIQASPIRNTVRWAINTDPQEIL
jgi:primosomal protein N' (replication factor Y) (superfamily II helicase)